MGKSKPKMKYILYSKICGGVKYPITRKSLIKNDKYSEGKKLIPHEFNHRRLKKIFKNKICYTFWKDIMIEINHNINEYIPNTEFGYGVKLKFFDKKQ